METHSATTLPIAGALGLFLIAKGTGQATSSERWRDFARELDRQPGLLYALGMFAFLVGTLTLMAHRHWSDPLAIIVTGFGWAALVEGVLLIAVPEKVVGFIQPFAQTGFVRARAVVTALVGLFVFIASLSARVVPS